MRGACLLQKRERRVGTKILTASEPLEGDRIMQHLQQHIGEITDNKSGQQTIEKFRP